MLLPTAHTVRGCYVGCAIALTTFCFLAGAAIGATIHLCRKLFPAGIATAFNQPFLHNFFLGKQFLLYEVNGNKRQEYGEQYNNIVPYGYDAQGNEQVKNGF